MEQAGKPISVVAAALSLTAAVVAPPAPPSRRSAIGLGAASALMLALQPTLAALAASDLVTPNLRLDLAPDQATFDAASPQLRAAAALLQHALNAEDVVLEEALWTQASPGGGGTQSWCMQPGGGSCVGCCSPQPVEPPSPHPLRTPPPPPPPSILHVPTHTHVQLIEQYGGLDAPWVPDVVGRAWGNRGNARSRQGKLEAALQDYNAAMQLCPWSVDPVLNRGVALEALGRFDEAIADYRAVLAAAPADPAPYNNLGNAYAGSGNYAAAVEYYGKAAAMAPEFSFAQVEQAGGFVGWVRGGPAA